LGKVSEGEDQGEPLSERWRIAWLILAGLLGFGAGITLIKIVTDEQGAPQYIQVVYTDANGQPVSTTTYDIERVINEMKTAGLPVRSMFVDFILEATTSTTTIVRTYTITETLGVEESETGVTIVVERVYTTTKTFWLTPPERTVSVTTEVMIPVTEIYNMTCTTTYTRDMDHTVTETTTKTITETTTSVKTSTTSSTSTMVSTTKQP